MRTDLMEKADERWLERAKSVGYKTEEAMFKTYLAQGLGYVAIGKKFVNRKGNPMSQEVVGRRLRAKWPHLLNETPAPVMPEPKVLYRAAHRGVDQFNPYPVGSWHTFPKVQSI